MLISILRFVASRAFPSNQECRPISTIRYARLTDLYCDWRSLGLTFARVTEPVMSIAFDVTRTILFPQKRSPLTGLGYFSESYRRDFPLHL